MGAIITVVNQKWKKVLNQPQQFQVKGYVNTHSPEVKWYIIAEVWFSLYASLLTVKGDANLPLCLPFCHQWFIKNIRLSKSQSRRYKIALYQINRTRRPLRMPDTNSFNFYLFYLVIGCHDLYSFFTKSVLKVAGINLNVGQISVISSNTIPIIVAAMLILSNGLRKVFHNNWPNNRGIA